MKIIKLETPDCRYCTMVGQALDSHGVAYESINLEDNPDVASKYDVMSVPVTMLLDDSEGIVLSSTGYKPNEIEEIVGKFTA